MRCVRGLTSFAGAFHVPWVFPRHGAGSGAASVSVRTRVRGREAAVGYARMVQHRPSPITDDEPLELPPSDGDTIDDDEESASADDVASVPADAADPYDDATGEDAPLEAEVDLDGDEASAVGDDDVGFAVHEQDVPEMALSEAALGDEEPPGVHGEDFGIVDDEKDEVRDAGEEGFDSAEPELRVEDLPQLDEGGDDELSLEEAIEPQPSTAELRWDDRSFERHALHRLGHVVGLRARGGLEVLLADGSALRSVDRGRTFSVADHVDLDDEAVVERGRARALLREGVGVLRTLGDGPLVPLESTEGAMAFTLLEDGTVIAAIESEGDRSQLVSVSVEGTCTIVADVSMECDDESQGGSPAVEALVADERAGLVWVGGAFGLLAFQLPASPSKSPPR